MAAVVDKVHILDKVDIPAATVGRTVTTKELLNVKIPPGCLACTRTPSATGRPEACCVPFIFRAAASGGFAPQDVERPRAEMFEQLASANEGPIVNAGRKRSGRLVFGDATE
jgi:hypothetical protein